MFDRIKEGPYWDRLWRLVDGCTPCSPGCRCWVAREARVRTYGAKDLLGPDGMWNGKIRLRHDNLDLPLRTRKPQAWLILNDLFHGDVSDEFIQAAYMRMWNTQQKHIYLVLTKRIDRARHHYNRWLNMKNVPKSLMCAPNIWLGVTVCNQEELWKLDELQDIPAAIHWVSFEPLLEDLGWINLKHVEFVVLGGESGPGARPMQPEWVRSVRDQCQGAGVPFFFKQWGKTPYPPNSDISPWIDAGFDPYSKNGGRTVDDREWNELPKGG